MEQELTAAPAGQPAGSRPRPDGAPLDSGK